MYFEKGDNYYCAKKIELPNSFDTVFLILVYIQMSSISQL